MPVRWSRSKSSSGTPYVRCTAGCAERHLSGEEALASSWMALLLGGVIAWGCKPSDPASDTATSPTEAKAYVDSLNQAVDELNVRLRAQVLDDPADFIGRVEGVSADSALRHRITIRYVVPGMPQEGRGRMSFVLRGEGALWDQNRTVLPLDSLKSGDLVTVWTQGRSVFAPTNPPLVTVRAVQRIDSFPPDM